ncbi:hypothetical protein [Luteolibacter soli]|uniref:Uncharacterized protein n=1 Tax=Luteolibacter soli TaxID=3135280 RepID=A0ABU9ASM9_9BACT
MSRRLTVADHAAWRDSLCTPGEIDDADRDLDLDIVEHPPAQRTQRETRRLLSILDDLDREGSLG